ncbi:MAG: hypothetical protein QXW79_00115 [Thermoplasmata archaeon]
MISVLPAVHNVKLVLAKRLRVLAKKNVSNYVVDLPMNVCVGVRKSA